jgi:mono/diheme cytochrome c family protein
VTVVLAAISTAAALALILGAIVTLAFVGALIALAARRRGPLPPDIPPGMKPGPSDDVLERRQLEKVMAWGAVFTVIFAVWLSVIWIGEPGRNVDDEIELIAKSVERGEQWFDITSEENPTGFGCARCHGEAGQGGQVIPFANAQGEQTQVQPPSLADVCARLPIEGDGGIRETIEEGRPGTAMPSWSVRYAGPMNDQQIQDIINYLVELNIETVGTGEENLCLNPPAEGETAEDTPTGTQTPGEGEETPAEGEETPSDDETGTPGGDATPTEEDA